MVHLVEHDEGTALLGAPTVQQRVSGHLRVGDGHPEEVPAQSALRVAELGVQGDPGAVSRLRPLPLEVLGRGHHGDGLDHASREQVGGHPQGEGRLAGARGRHGQEVARLRGGVRVQRFLLPGPERLRRPPRGSSREGRGEVGRRSAHEGENLRGLPRGGET